MKQSRLSRAILAALLLGISVSAAAQTAKPQLVVWQKNGEKVRYQLADQPETTFEDGLLVIRTKSTTVSYQLSNVLRYTYEGVGTSGIDLLPNERSVEVSQDGEAVTFRHLRQGTTVSLYAANGTLLETRRADTSAPVTLSVSRRPAGVYIVKAANETIKLLRK